MHPNLRDYGLCSDLHDGFIDVTHQYYWHVVLSTCQEVYQDDGRPGLEHSAWIRLAKFLQAFPTIRIVRYGVCFRDNHFYLPDQQPGYYFSNGALQGVGNSSRWDYYVMGWVESLHNSFDPVHFHWIKVPELIPINSYTKPIVECPFPAMVVLTNPDSEL